MELKDIKGLGKASLEALALEGINTIDDLLFTFPTSYDVFELDDSKVFSGEITCISVILDSKPAFIKYRTNVYSIIFYVLIGNYKMKCIMFSSDYLRYKLFKGTSCILHGRFKKESKEFLVRHVFFNDFENKVSVNYKYKNIKSYTITKAIHHIFDEGYSLGETLPKEILEKYKLLTYKDFVYLSHLPKNKEDIRQIQRRRKYEEFYWYQMSFSLLKEMRMKNQKPKREVDMTSLKKLTSSIGFELTQGQKDAIMDCLHDIKGITPMNRLVQGDVGCGKSIVAVYAILALLSAGYQGALMVPTELLANQQYSLLKSYFDSFDIKVELLTSSTKKKEKTRILEETKNGKIKLLVGTHALLEDNVAFYKLGIVVIDEQHKFGVNQRKKLIEKYPDVDCLYLTATPIPRTLGLTFFGDLDITSIKTMPKGRIPIDTKMISYSKLSGLLRFIHERIREGEQVYVVVPLVIENEEYHAMPIGEAEKIFKEALPDVLIETVHGKMASDKKREAMEKFRSGDAKILISTTVIEVGVNVPSATIMVIMDADYFGLAQIHQLRGRVGRGDKKSYCALVTKNMDNERLKALEVLSDGFGIADEDFRSRGPGDYFGEEQSGFSMLEYVDFEMDYKIWECAKKDAMDYLPKYLNGNEISIRFTNLLLKNTKNGFKIN